MKRGLYWGTHLCDGLNRQAPVARFGVWVGPFQIQVKGIADWFLTRPLTA